MRTRDVKQYICDFCGKRGYSSGHMKRHEIHCTMNPGRKCRMCDLLEVVHDPQHLLSILPLPIYKIEEGEGEILVNKKEIEAALVRLREEAGHCPACILSALRRRGIHPRAIGFDYPKEIKEFWDEYNKEDCGVYP